MTMLHEWEIDPHDPMIHLSLRMSRKEDTAAFTAALEENPLYLEKYTTEIFDLCARTGCYPHARAFHEHGGDIGAAIDALEKKHAAAPRDGDGEKAKASAATLKAYQKLFNAAALQRQMMDAMDIVKQQDALKTAARDTQQALAQHNAAGHADAARQGRHPKAVL